MNINRAREQACDFLRERLHAGGFMHDSVRGPAAKVLAIAEMIGVHDDGNAVRFGGERFDKLQSGHVEAMLR